MGSTPASLSSPATTPESLSPSATSPANNIFRQSLRRGVPKKSIPPKEETVQIDSSSSDSDSEVFVNGTNGTPIQTTGKASTENLKSGKKASLDSLKTGGKTSFETPASKGDSGKGGKGYSSGKAGGKGSAPQASAAKPTSELNLEIDLPKNARILMDCEGATILQGIQDNLSMLSDDPKIKMPGSFSKALQYCKNTNQYTNSESARQVLDTLKLHGVTDGEICMIGNVCPETVDEVYALVPSLKAKKHKNEEPIRDALADLAKLKCAK